MNHHSPVEKIIATSAISFAREKKVRGFSRKLGGK
jgi:hypothetical protein